MRVAYRRQHPGADGDIPDFLRSEFVSGTWERTGFDVDFPAIVKEPRVAAAVGYTGRNFIGDSVDITRWYNRAKNVIAGSVIFSAGCEGPPGAVHGGAVASVLDDILGTMVWREAGFSRWGIPTMQLTVRYRGATPMERRLRFDTHVVKREGRKVFVEATLRDPASGNKLLAEGEGLFYMRRPPSPPEKSSQPSMPPSPLPSRRRESSSSSVRTAATETSAALAATGPGSKASSGRRASPAAKREGCPPATSRTTTAPGADGRGDENGRTTMGPRRFSSSSSPTTTTASATATVPTTAPTTPGATKREVLSYDEAIREFGPGNPNAAANVVAFYLGDATAFRPRARL